MIYLHTPEYQFMLQAAVKERHLRETDDQIRRNSGLTCSSSTLQRFRLSKNLASAADDARVKPRAKGRRPHTLMFDYYNAEKLWRYCREEIENLARRGVFPFRQTERFAAAALHAFYAAEASNTVDEANDYFHENYYCYKPSFRRPKFVVKSRFTMRAGPGNEYLMITEQQATKYYGTLQAAEHSNGFAVSQSDRLWFFMMEQSAKQPRIFCFNQFSHSYDNKIDKLRGHVLESSKRFVNGVFGFPVGLVSRRADEQLWKQRYPEDPYDEDAQINTVFYPPGGANAPIHPESGRIVFDHDMYDYLFRTMTQDLDYVPPDDGITAAPRYRIHRP